MKSSETPTEYIRVTDDDDGTILVDDDNGRIESFSYSSRTERGKARKDAEELAARVADARGCDWGCNY